MQSNSPFLCKFCSRPVLNRRVKKCMYCGGDLPESALLDETATEKILSQREAERRRHAEHKEANPDKPSAGNESAWIVDGIAGIVTDKE